MEEYGTNAKLIRRWPRRPGGGGGVRWPEPRLWKFDRGPAVLIVLATDAIAQVRSQWPQQIILTTHMFGNHLRLSMNWYFSNLRSMGVGWATTLNVALRFFLPSVIGGKYVIVGRRYIGCSTTTRPNWLKLQATRCWVVLSARGPGSKEAFNLVPTIQELLHHAI
jgi:hypothetical protein